jgi:3'(2'), 5'-bisphosphate nucleotidase
MNSEGGKTKLSVITGKTTDTITIVATRSHKTKELQDYLERLKKRYREVDYICIGSSLKFCIIAEGKAHVYPKFGNTMEWDTAAGQIIVEEAGGIVATPEGSPLRYNKESLKNDGFFCSCNTQGVFI